MIKAKDRHDELVEKHYELVDMKKPKIENNEKRARGSTSGKKECKLRKRETKSSRFRARIKVLSKTSFILQRITRKKY